MSKCLATTMDNPWNPYTNPREWSAFDHLHGYNTRELLAYFSYTSTELEEEDYDEEVNNGVNRLLEFNPFGMHYKLYEDEADEMIKLANAAYKEQNKENEDK